MSSTVTIYVWGQWDATGHVSVQVDRGSYLSFHPEHRNYADETVGRLVDAVLGSRMAPDGYFGNPADDVKRHRKHTDSVSIDWLDTEAMEDKKSEWDSMLRTRNLQYNLITRNCSTMAAEFLLAGAGLELDAHAALDKMIRAAKNASPATPPTDRQFSTRFADQFFESTEQASLLKCARRGAMGSLGSFLRPAILVDLLVRAVTWTPGDALRLAKELAKKNHNRWLSQGD